MDARSGTQWSAERWARLEPLFHAALEMAVEDREAFIAQATADDASLGDEVRAMLRHTDGAGKRIAGTVQRMTARVAAGTPWIGRHFGPYRVVREIGRGGMGMVFEAVRDDAEYDKRVALKAAPEWRDLQGWRERFRRERQILARIEHPNVARFLDGGTEGGIPWFAMEYVDGKPITVWAMERHLSVRERVALFRQVCGSVSHAHENLIIHRDLKPANILVDAAGTPKLLDFGIAGLLDAAENASTTLGARLWTPDYASPEQLRNGAVTVRTDIYSLGLTLYELLCGERAQIADVSSPLALDRSVCEREPPPPSERAAAAGNRNVARELRGDLDKIVAMAIRKEPSRRYGSAAALNAELGRWLAGQTVEARPNTAWYRASRMVRRHRVGTAAAGLVAISLAGGVASTLYQAHRANRRFQEVRGLANAFIFDVHDRIQNLPGSTEARKAIVATALRYLESLRKEAGNDPALIRDLAAAYLKVGDAQGDPVGSSLGDTHGALESYRRSASLLEPLAQKGDDAAREALVAAIYKTGVLQNTLGDAAGERELERARTMARHLVAEQPRSLTALRLTANLNSDIARLQADARKPQAALESAQEALALAQRMADLDPASEATRDYLAVCKNGLGIAYLAADDRERALEVFRSSLAMREALVREHPDNMGYRRLLLVCWGHLGDTLGLTRVRGIGRLAESAEAYEKAADIAAWISARDPANQTALFDLAVAHMRTASVLLEEPGGAGRALTHLTAEDAILTRLAQNDPQNQRYRIYELVLDCDMGKALAAAGRNPEAVRRLERARQECSGFAGGPNDKNAKSWGLSATMTLANVRAAMGDARTAAALADEAAAAIGKGSVYGSTWAHAFDYGQLGRLYRRLGKKESARMWLRKSADQYRAMKVSGTVEGQRRKELATVEADLEGLG